MDADLIIIGGGPAGYVAAIRAGQLGLRAVLIEKERLGGMCLNWGCIPFAALLESAKLFERMKRGAEFGISGIESGRLAFDWPAAARRAGRIVGRLTRGIEFLMKKNKVAIIQAEARLAGPGAVMAAGRRLSSAAVIVATGSLPPRPEYKAPPEKVVELRGMLQLGGLPDRLAVVGSGASAVEAAQLISLCGRRVTLLSPAPALVPRLDPYLSAGLEKILVQQGIEVRKNAAVVAWDGQGLISDAGPIPCDMLVHAPDRAAVVPAGDPPLARADGFIETDDHFQTSIPGIYAVGDVNGRFDQAHAASAQGLHVVDHIKGSDAPFPAGRVPRNIYTHPEVAQVGPGEPELRARGIDYRIGGFSLAANGKALAAGESEGFIRVLAERKHGEVLGVQILAAQATDLIAEAGLLLEMEGTAEDLARTIHAHPTVSEIFGEAGLDAFASALHK